MNTLYLIIALFAFSMIGVGALKGTRPVSRKALPGVIVTECAPILLTRLAQTITDAQSDDDDLYIPLRPEDWDVADPNCTGCMEGCEFCEFCEPLLAHDRQYERERELYLYDVVQIPQWADSLDIFPF